MAIEAAVICPKCRGERRIKGLLCDRCSGNAQISRADLAHDETALFELKRSAMFCFEGGSLTIKLHGYGTSDGDGHFAFDDDDLQWERDHESPNTTTRWISVPASELTELRDFLNKHFPLAPDKAADAEADPMIAFARVDLVGSEP